MVVLPFVLTDWKLIDQDLRQGEAEFEQLQQTLQAGNPLLHQKLKIAQTEKQDTV